MQIWAIRKYRRERENERAKQNNFKYLVQTLFRNAIKDEGGIPGFEELDDKTSMFSDLSESWARFKASNESFTADETWINSKDGHAG